MNAATERYRALLSEIAASTTFKEPRNEVLFRSLRHRLAGSALDQPNILAEIYALSTGIAPTVFLPVMSNLHQSLQNSITQMVDAIPVTRRRWLPREIFAALFPIGEPNAERHQVEDETDLLLVDPMLLFLFESMSMALMSQTVIGNGLTQDRQTAARFVHETFLGWTTGWATGYPSPLTMVSRLTGEQRYFGSLLTRRALDYVVAHELGHIVANKWPDSGPRLVPSIERGGTWEFDRRQFSSEWDRELRADSVACWILSHAVLDATLNGHDRYDLLMSVFGGAALALAIAAIHEKIALSPPVITSREHASQRLHWNESQTHPAAIMRATEILTGLTSWMGDHDEAKKFTMFVLAELPTLWQEGARP